MLTTDPAEKLFREYRYTLATRPNDLDILGHVNNAVALEYFEAGRWDWRRRVGLEASAVAVVVSRIEVDYLGQIFPGEIVVVTRFRGPGPRWARRPHPLQGGRRADPSRPADRRRARARAQHARVRRRADAIALHAAGVSVAAARRCGDPAREAGPMTPPDGRARDDDAAAQAPGPRAARRPRRADRRVRAGRRALGHSLLRRLRAGAHLHFLPDLARPRRAGRGGVRRARHRARHPRDPAVRYVDGGHRRVPRAGSPGRARAVPQA